MEIMKLDELMKLVTDKFGETPDDDALTIIENISDTFNDLSGKVSDDWQKEKARLEQAVIDKDNEWRKKYTERFVTGRDAEGFENKHTPENEPEYDETNIEISDLFTEVK